MADKTIELKHDGTNAQVKFKGTDLVVQTDEGTDNSTSLTVKGKGTGKGKLELYDQSGANKATLQTTDTLTAGFTLTLPDGDGDAGQHLKTDGSGNLAWENTQWSAYTVPADGSDGQHLKTDGAGNLAWEDPPFEDYTLPGADGSNEQVLTTDGSYGLTWSTVTGAWQDYTWPGADGTSGQHLKTDGAGTLGWEDPPVCKWDAYTVPADGSSGQHLTTNGSGTLSWVNTQWSAYTVPGSDGSNGDVLATDGSYGLSWKSGATVLNPSGSIIMYGGTSAPSGWLLCNGAAVSRTTYADLFTAISTNFGVGDGSTTFNLPDLRSRSPVGAGQGSGLTNRSIGSTGGSENHQLTASQMPSHRHSVRAGCGVYAAPYYGVPVLDTWSNTGTYTSYTSGGGGSHNTMHPWQAASFIIKT